jgi:DNA-directed RNA polymerase subunit H (RpoH/RPB5)
MDAEVFDILFRSRKTLLNILANKGYDISQYEKFGPWEIESMISNENKNALGMALVKKEGDEKCNVIYRLKKVKNSLNSFLANHFINEDADEYKADYLNADNIIIVLETVNNPVFHEAALMMYQKHKIRVSFFQAHSLVNNPSEHVLVPKHELVAKEDISELKKKLNIQSVSNLPFIRFHQDIQARLLGALPGDVIKITRPSPSAGVETVYRVCIP